MIKKSMGLVTMVFVMLVATDGQSTPFSYEFEKTETEEFFVDIVYVEALQAYAAVGEGELFNDLTHVTLFDELGDVIWTNWFHGPSVEVVDVEVYQDQYIVMAANMYNHFLGYEYPVITMFDSSGNVVWVKQYSQEGSHSIQVRDLETIDGDPNIYLTGEFETSIGDDIWFSKIDGAGLMVWQYHYSIVPLNFTQQGMALKNYSTDTLMIGADYESVGDPPEWGVMFVEVSKNNGNIIDHHRQATPGYMTHLQDIDILPEMVAFTGWTNSVTQTHDLDLIVGLFEVSINTVTVDKRVRYAGYNFPEQGFGIMAGDENLYISGEMDDLGEFHKNRQGVLLSYNYSSSSLNWISHYGDEDDDFFRGINPGSEPSVYLDVAGAFRFDNYTRGWASELPLSTGSDPCIDCLGSEIVPDVIGMTYVDETTYMTSTMIETFQAEPEWELWPIHWNVQRLCD